MLWIAATSLYIIAAFDMLPVLIAFGMLINVWQDTEYGLLAQGRGPHLSVTYIALQLAPIAVLNLLMPVFFHVVFGYYTRHTSTVSGAIFLVGVVYVTISVEGTAQLVHGSGDADVQDEDLNLTNVDWGTILFVTLVSRAGLALLTLWKEYQYQGRAGFCNPEVVSNKR